MPISSKTCLLSLSGMATVSSFKGQWLIRPQFNDSSMKVTSKIGLFAVASVISLVLTGALDHENIERLKESRIKAEKTKNVITGLSSLMSTVQDAENQTRGYAITLDPDFISDFPEIRKRANSQLEQIGTLLSGSGAQQLNLNRLQDIVNARFKIADDLLQTARQQGSEAACAYIATKTGLNQTKEIQQVVEEMQRNEQSMLQEATDRTLRLTEISSLGTVYGTSIALFATLLLATLTIRSIQKSMALLMAGVGRITEGDLTQSIDISTKDELGVLAQSFNQMTARLQRSNKENSEQAWLKESLNKIALLLQEHRTLDTAATALLSELSSLIDLKFGVVYVPETVGESMCLKLVASHACAQPDKVPATLQPGQTLLGQCALEKKKFKLKSASADNVIIRSALCDSSQASSLMLPVVFEDKLLLCMELVFTDSPAVIEEEFLDQLSIWLGSFIKGILATDETVRLLSVSQDLNEELRQQQEELESQHLEMENQQEEMRQLYDELEQKAAALESSMHALGATNEELEQAQASLQARAEELLKASKYKSEFLANMSHDLRTPLNSLLIYAGLLYDNMEGNLSSKQTDFAQNIKDAGKSLLALIDDVLDLAKIESGMLPLEIRQMPLARLSKELERTFTPLADSKSLEFSVKIDSAVPDTISTDEKRLQQVLINLLANAFKFTEQGHVHVKVSHSNDNQIVFEIEDTGIGIPEDKHEIIFQPFEQGDPRTKQKYGGTGLGLAICKNLSEILKGKLQLRSKPGAGSVFTLSIPGSVELKSNQPVISGASSAKLWDGDESKLNELLKTNTLDDDRASVLPGDKTLLIVEDDEIFAKALVDTARAFGFKMLRARSGAEGLFLTEKYTPSGITLDLGLPDMDGWAFFDQIKNSPQARHIPVHIISVRQECERGLSLGAIGYLEKPFSIEPIAAALQKLDAFINKRAKKLLIVEDDNQLSQSMKELLSNDGVEIHCVQNGDEAFSMLSAHEFDCMVLDLGLPDMTGFELMSKLQSQENLGQLPVIVYTGRDLTRTEEESLRKVAKAVIVKGVRSPERLLQETTLFLHTLQKALPAEKQNIIKMQQDSVLSGKCALIIDDDHRNIAALQHLLEKFRIQVLSAQSGKAGLDTLRAHSEIDVVLMDVMMPEMDGYEAMRIIRQDQSYKKLPIIAITAKAMKDDRQKCLLAGASDYITKPVDANQLLSLLRVWLYERQVIERA